LPPWLAPPPAPARPTGGGDKPDDDHVNADRRPDTDVIGNIDRVLEDLSGD
jgi:hypothetical protein